MKLIAAIFLLAGIASAQTNVSFSGPRNYLGNNSAIADFNHDGILDLATVDQSTGLIHIHAGTGNGTFAGDEILTLPMVVEDQDVLLTADLNGDGFPDLIVGQATTPSILVFLGNAAGGFTPSATYHLTTGVDNLYLADLNLDGKLDLVCGAQTGISVALGNGDGTFQHPSMVFLQQVNEGLAIADFNGDGEPDLAVPQTSGVTILFGDGAGNFKTGTSFTTTQSFGPAAAADLNEDGKQDLVLETASKGLVEVLLGNGDGSFRAPEIYIVSTSGAPAVGLAIGDVNGDGFLDIVTPDPAVLLGKGDGTFSTSVLYPANSDWYNVQLADLTGAGSLDIVAADNSSNSATTVLLNSGQGKFEDDPVVRVSNAGTCIAVADFNNDGHEDAAVSSGAGIQILLGTGVRNPALQSSITFSLKSSRAVCPIAGDFNNDGIPDLLVNMNTGDLEFLAGIGDGTFAAPIGTGLPAAPQVLVGADFNGDANLDLAGTSASSEKIELLFGDGTGRFAAPVTISAPTGVRSLVAADLNGDGRPDIVAVTQDPNGVTVLLNVGGDAFHSQSYPLDQSPLSVQVADLNGDGVPDLVVVGQTTVFTYIGQGAGIFLQTSQLTAKGVSAVVTDFNGDGIPDLALDDGSEVKLFFGDGTGAFVSAGNPDGIWFAIAGTGSALAAARLQSQSSASGLSDLITLGTYPGVGYVGELLNQGVAH